MVYGIAESEMTEQLTHTQGNMLLDESLFPYIKYILPVVYMLYSISSMKDLQLYSLNVKMYYIIPYYCY